MPTKSPISNPASVNPAITSGGAIRTLNFNLSIFSRPTVELTNGCAAIVSTANIPRGLPAFTNLAFILGNSVKLLSVSTLSKVYCSSFAKDIPAFFRILYAPIQRKKGIASNVPFSIADNERGDTASANCCIFSPSHFLVVEGLKGLIACHLP